MESGWLVQSRPQIACHIDIRAQVTEPHFRSEGTGYLRTLHKIIEEIPQAPQRGFCQSKLDMDTVHLLINSGCSFANRRVLTLELGLKIVASDANDACYFGSDT